MHVKWINHALIRAFPPPPTWMDDRLHNFGTLLSHPTKQSLGNKDHLHIDTFELWHLKLENDNNCELSLLTG